MQIETVTEILMEFPSYYLWMAACVFIACVSSDRYDYYGPNKQDHKSFPFYICVIMYAAYSVLWLPMLISGIIKDFKNK